MQWTQSVQTGPCAGSTRKREGASRRAIFMEKSLADSPTQFPHQNSCTSSEMQLFFFENFGSTPIKCAKACCA